jgi:lipooligosaccharide transport system permease protein
VLDALRPLEFFLLQYRRAWHYTFATSFANPLLYLGALGVGLGKIARSDSVGGHEYLHFVGPGLLAAAAMQVAFTESSNPVTTNFLWSRNYYAMNATPLGARDILAGQQLFAAVRVLVSATFYLAVIAALGGVQSPFGVLALPASILVGFAFSAPMAAYAGWVEDNSTFPALARFVITPMFLFSGIFYPVTKLPDPARWVAYATPLWHGAELCRDLVLGQVSALDDVGHAAYLLLWAAAGFALAIVTHRRRLQR